ncbi:hypothetical protein BgiMline_032176 [Biomphalaria glabrata]
MTHAGESQSHLEADRPKTIISTKTTTTIGTWNVRTMYETGKSAQVAAGMKKYNLTILGISESIWTGYGQTRLTSVQGEALEEVESFTYLSSILDHHGGTDADVRTRIGKARAAFHQLKNTWGSREISTTTKIKLFNTVVKPTLLYGAETWRTTITTMKKQQPGFKSRTPSSEAKHFTAQPQHLLYVIGLLLFVPASRGAF